MTRFSQIALVFSWLFAAFAVFLFAGFQYGEPVWLLDPVVMLFASGFSLALALPLGLFGLNTLLGAGTRWIWISAIALSGALLFSLLLAYLVTGVTASRTVLAYETMLVLAILVVNLLPSRYTWAKIAANLVLFAVAIAPSLTATSLISFRELVVGRSSIDFDESARFVITSRHDLKVTNLKLFDERLEQGGGGLILIDQDRFLIGSAYGRFFDVTLRPGDDVSVVETTIRAPLNRSDYMAGAKHPTRMFRVTDVFLVDGTGPQRTLLASHHFWNTEKQCLTMRLSEATIDLDNLTGSPPEWRTRFESQPCMIAARLVNHNGGRIEYLTPDSVLMSVGSNAYDQEAATLAEFDDSSYGKIFEIDLDDWSADVFSRGHRNVQGIYVRDGVIWSTEHGPQGGDELNFLRRDADYGWPRATYGTEYGQRNWPMTVGALPHSYGQKPAFAWVPSIGVSNLVQITATAFPGWQGDLVVGSLDGASGDAGRSLYRVAVDAGRAVLAERIYTGERVRDLVERRNGTLVLWDGLQILQIVEPTTHLFSACTGCHGIRDRETHGVGPDLLGITGDKVASRRDYDYSEALTAFGGRWTTERLDAYLRDPDGVVPGTTMLFPGIEDAALRAEIIEYLTRADR